MMCTENKSRNRQIEAYERRQMTVIIPESYRCVLREGRRGRWEVCGRRKRWWGRGWWRGRWGQCHQNRHNVLRTWGKVGWASKVGVGWVWWWLGGSQGPVSRFVFSHNVFAAAQLLPQVGYLRAESGVLLLQEGGPDGDLVLLQPPSVPWPLGCHVVLSASGPVLIILKSRADRYH